MSTIAVVRPVSKRLRPRRQMGAVTMTTVGSGIATSSRSLSCHSSHLPRPSPHCSSPLTAGATRVLLHHGLTADLSRGFPDFDPTQHRNSKDLITETDSLTPFTERTYFPPFPADSTFHSYAHSLYHNLTFKVALAENSSSTEHDDPRVLQEDERKVGERLE